MKAPGKDDDLNTHSATQFLYRITKALSLTSKAGNRYGHSETFSQWCIVKGFQCHLTPPLHSNRFLVYSYNAYAIYNDLHVYRNFLQKRLEDTWTRQFLLASLSSPLMCHELRLLGLFHYFFFGPLTFTLSVLVNSLCVLVNSLY
mmetsp:Transcript_40591/g.56414  ORF Transcript_40591/g.56414 Transcript_40591/m.56414 type:complete len:145 (+) Transcript_40591:597-1031(+)